MDINIDICIMDYCPLFIDLILIGMSFNRTVFQHKRILFIYFCICFSFYFWFSVLFLFCFCLLFIPFTKTTKMWLIEYSGCHRTFQWIYTNFCQVMKETWGLVSFWLSNSRGFSLIVAFNQLNSEQYLKFYVWFCRRIL